MTTTMLNKLFTCIYRPIAKMFYGEVRSNEETDRTGPEGGCYFERFEKLVIC